MEKDCENIPLQGKDIRNSRKLGKVVAINKTNKIALSKKYMSLKTRDINKVRYPRLIFCNQLIKSSMFLVLLLAMIIQKKELSQLHRA